MWTEGLVSPQSVDHDRRWGAYRATHVDRFARWSAGAAMSSHAYHAAVSRLEKALSASRPDTGLSARLRRDRLQLSHSLCDIQKRTRGADHQEQAMKLQSAIRAEAMAPKHPFTP
jgi:hypothetical protein